jgi:chromosome partitioning protein
LGARVLSIANQKGGVGKTTTALSLGQALSRKGKRVLVMDLDPHGCASVHLAYFPENLSRTSYDLLIAPGRAECPWDTTILTGHSCGFDFVASDPRLAGLDFDLKERQGKGVILKEYLADISERYDYILVDCPPGMGVLLVNALVAANLLIIPAQTDFLALHGMRLIFDTLRTLSKVLSEPVPYKVLATMYDKRAGACRRVMWLLMKKLGDRMFKTVIETDTQFREASAKGVVIFDVAPHSRGAMQYERLAKEIMGDL